MFDSDTEIRTTRVTIWLSPDETQTIDLKRGHYSRASYLRAAGLDKEIARAPAPICREQWADLGHVRGSLTGVHKHLNFAAAADGRDGAVRATLEKLGDVNEVLDQLRAWLQGSTDSIMMNR